MDDLLQRWVDALGPSPRAVVTGRELVRRYTEAHRRYHDVQHLREVLHALDLLSAGAELPLAVVCAAFWHDAVYDPTAADNERRSVDLAAAALDGLGLAHTLVDEVTRLVLLTTGHDPQAGDAHGALLCDADLAVLAAAQPRYGAYAAAVRQEYAHLSDDDFRRGRAAVLRELLHRPQLFSTPEGQRRWQRAARVNLQAELDRLTGPSDAAGPLP